MKNKILMLTLLLSVFIFSLVIIPMDSSAGGQRDFVVWEVKIVQGYVKVRLPDQKTYTKVNIGDKIPKNSYIVTGKNSFLEIRGVRDAYVIRFLEATSGKIEEITFDQTKMKVFEGNVFIQITDTMKIQKKVFLVTTPLIAAELEPQSAVYIDIKTSTFYALKGRTHLYNAKTMNNVRPLEGPEAGTKVILKPDSDPKTVEKSKEDPKKILDIVNGATQWEELKL